MEYFVLYVGIGFIFSWILNQANLTFDACRKILE